MELSLNELIATVLQQQEIAGFKTSTIAVRRRIYKRLEILAEQMGIYEFNEELATAFVSDSFNRKNGEFCKSRYCLHSQAVYRLRMYKDYGYIDWTRNTSVFAPREIPNSKVFRNLIESYINFLANEGKHKNTLESYRNITAKFLIFCESNDVQKINEISPKNVPQFIQKLIQTWSPLSVRTASSALRSFLMFAGVNDSVMRAVPLRCPRKTSILPILAQHQEEELWNHLYDEKISTRDRAIFVIIFVTGLRPIDVVNLKLEDIDWKKGIIHIIQQKTGNALTLPVAPAVGNALMDYIIYHRPETPYRNVFVKNEAPYTPLTDHSACYAIIRKIFINAGTETENNIYGARLLRHDAASNFMKAGIPINSIAASLGHTDYGTIDIYLSADEKMMRRCVLPLPNIRREVDHDE